MSAPLLSIVQQITKAITKKTIEIQFIAGFYNKQFRYFQRAKTLL